MVHLFLSSENNLLPVGIYDRPGIFCRFFEVFFEKLVQNFGHGNFAVLSPLELEGELDQILEDDSRFVFFWRFENRRFLPGGDFFRHQAKSEGYEKRDVDYLHGNFN